MPELLVQFGGFKPSIRAHKNISHPERVAYILSHTVGTLANESCRFLIARIAFAIPRVLIKHPDAQKDSHPRWVTVFLARPKGTLANESLRFLIARIACAIRRVQAKHPGSQKYKPPRKSGLYFGAPEGTRTPNTMPRKHVLYPLSYGRLQRDIIP